MNVTPEEWVQPTPEDIEAAAKLIGDRMPRQIMPRQIVGRRQDICTHCGPFATSLSFGNHLQEEHQIGFKEWSAVVK